MSRNALVAVALVAAIVLALLGHGHLADDVIDAVPPEAPAPEPTPDAVMPPKPEPIPEPVGDDTEPKPEPS
jgi:hypothetical protein